MADQGELSRHAAMRMSQRGVTYDFLGALLDHADREIAIGSGAIAIGVSRARSAALNLDDRLHRYAAVLGADGHLITVLPLLSGRRGRRYRREWR